MLKLNEMKNITYEKYYLSKYYYYYCNYYIILCLLIYFNLFNYMNILDKKFFKIINRTFLII